MISDKWVVLSAFGDLQAARDRSDQLQQQLAQRGTDLHAVQEELDKLQKDYSDKCDEVIADKQERAVMLLHAVYSCWTSLNVCKCASVLISMSLFSA